MKTYSDLTGRRFGKLTVVNLDKKSGNKYYWKCICDCGNEKIIRADRLLCGECVHCGCEKKVRYNRENYIGKRFGNLTVLNEVSKEYKNGEIRYFYDCICDCGSLINHISRQGLQQGKIAMCKNCQVKNQYDLTSHAYGVGYCDDGKEFYFDLEDYEKIKPYHWYMTEYGYVRASIGGNSHIFMHNLVFNKKDKIDVDHKNRKKNDNRKKNLRPATRGENVINRDPIIRNTSGVTGVTYNKNAAKWQASIMKDGEHYHLGLFNSFTDAVDTRRKAEVSLFDEYAYLQSKDK